MMRWTELPEFQNPPNGWETARLTNKVDFVAGQSPDSSTYNQLGEGLPFLQGNADFGRLHPDPSTYCTAPTKQCEAGDTLISVRAPVGEVNRADQVYGLGRGVGALHPKNIDSNYLFYGMQRWKLPLSRAAQGSTFDAVTARHFRQLKICLPIDWCEQQAIAQRLCAGDDAITAAEAKLAAARRVKTALMQQLFTRGIPGRHAKFKQTKIGEIPEEWDVVNLKHLASAMSGIALNSDREPKFNPCKYLTVIHVQREQLDLSEVRYLELKPNEIPTMLLEEGDILVVEGHANSSEIGRAAIVTDEAARLTYQNHLFRVSLLPDAEMDRQFLLGVLNSQRVRRHWNATCNTSSGLNTINHRGLRNLLIQRPTLGEQREITTILKSVNALIKSCENELDAVRRLKQSLLQNLLTGKVRVNVEAAA